MEKMRAWANRHFWAMVFGTSVLLFLASSIEYQGPEYMKYAAIMTCLVLVGTVRFVLSAIELFQRAALARIWLAIGCLMGLPFLVGGLLTIMDKGPNIHGSAFLGWIIYYLGSLGTAVGLLIALAVRKWSSRSSGNESAS
jgi:heme/copper-type cytochrome/quinol oxidase subunit 3